MKRSNGMFEAFKMMFYAVMVMLILYTAISMVRIARAQDEEIGDYPGVSQTVGTEAYVCRNGFYHWLRLEFHNTDSTAYVSEAEAASMIGNVWVSDSLLGDASNGGTAYDYAVLVYDGGSLRGDMNTLPCYGTPGYIDPTTQEQPFPDSNVLCDAWATNQATGIPYCYIAQANGVVPIPPAP